MKKILALLLAAALVMSLAACSSSSSDDSSDSSDTAAEEETSEDADDSGGSYAIIMKSESNSFWATMHDALKEYASENGISLDLYTAASDTDDAGQQVLMELCISSGKYDVIGIAPADSITMVASVKEANDAGIQIVTIDEMFDSTEMEEQDATTIAGVSSDNEAVGYMGAEYLCSLIEEGSQVAIVQGIAGNISSVDRTAGAQSAFDDYGMEVVASEACDWDMETAMNFVAETIEAYPDLQAIYVCNDTMAAGVRQAVADSSNPDILVCGTDGDEGAIKAVAGVSTDGITMAATVAQDSASIGIAALEIMIDAYENPDDYSGAAVTDVTYMDPILVTAENASEYLTE